jgi:hypothetical protein
MVLLLVQIQIWWAAYAERTDAEWSFLGFFVFLLLPICAALVSYLLVPDLEGEHHELDLRASFIENLGWFQGLMGFIVVVSLARDLLEDGREALDLDAAFRGGFLVLAILAARSRSDAFHVVNALAVLLLFCGYIATLFVRLG